MTAGDGGPDRERGARATRCHERRRSRVAWIVLAGAFGPALAPVGAPGQQVPAAVPARIAPDDAGARWFPDRFVTSPFLAAPREVRLQGGFFATERDADPGFDGRSVEAEVAVGYRVPVVRLADRGPDGPAVDLGFEVGTWSRFYMEATTRDLVGVDYRVGAPLGLRWRRLEGRLTLHHTSAHLGDDYVDRFGVPAYQVSREALELVLAVRPLAPVRLYGGGEWNVGRGSDYAPGTTETFHTVERWTLRAGAEYDARASSRRSVRPFAAVNLETTDWTDRLATQARAGIAFRVRSIRVLLDAQWRDGPSTLGQFRTADESMLGVGMEVQLGGLIPPGPAGGG
jgi:hypothetical protein